jgi:murein DD-endopeptidase MepM/ murein hydrolase activator NlpD
MPGWNASEYAPGVGDCSKHGRERLHPVNEAPKPPPLVRVNHREPESRRAGFVPAWLGAARHRAGIKGLLPPDPIPGRASAKARTRELDDEKRQIRRLWLEWRFNEVDYKNLAHFSRHARAAVGAEWLDDKTVLRWIGNWEREARVSYGSFLGPSGEIYKRYGHPAHRLRDRKRKSAE